MTHTHDKAQKIVQAVEGTDEPVFILRAQDFFSIQGLIFYQRTLEAFGPETLPVQQSTQEAINEFKAWQRANMAKVKYPD